MEEEEAGKRSRVSSGHSTGQPPRKRVAKGENELSSKEIELNLSDFASNKELEVSEHGCCGHVRSSATGKYRDITLFATPCPKPMSLICSCISLAVAPRVG